jgi:hypothetical protein
VFRSVEEKMKDHIKFLLLSLLNYEKDLESKLDLLTSIGITSSNEKVFNCCEEIRNDHFPDGHQEIKIERQNPLSGGIQWEEKAYSGDAKSTEIHGEL